MVGPFWNLAQAIVWVLYRDGGLATRFASPQDGVAGVGDLHHYMARRAGDSMDLLELPPEQWHREGTTRMFLMGRRTEERINAAISELITSGLSVYSNGDAGQRAPIPRESQQPPLGYHRFWKGVHFRESDVRKQWPAAPADEAELARKIEQQFQPQLPDKPTWGEVRDAFPNVQSALLKRAWGRVSGEFKRGPGESKKVK
jgi:hypothetical protein